MGEFALGKAILGFLLFVVSLFMILLILVQRGKGGGLTGALGGMGGQSAFGSKAGDLFTRITVVTAIVWITLCMLTIALYNPPPPPEAKSPGPPTMGTGSETGEQDAAGTDSNAAGDTTAEDAFEDPADANGDGGAASDAGESGQGDADASDPALVPPDSSDSSGQESPEGSGDEGSGGSDGNGSDDSNDNDSDGGNGL